MSRVYPFYDIYGDIVYAACTNISNSSSSGGGSGSEQLRKHNMTIYKLHKLTSRWQNIISVVYVMEVKSLAESSFTETLLTSIHCNDLFSQSQLHFHFFPVIIYYIFQCTY